MSLSFAEEIFKFSLKIQKPTNIILLKIDTNNIFFSCPFSFDFLILIVSISFQLID